MWPTSKPTSNKRWRPRRNNHYPPTAMENPAPSGRPTVQNQPILRWVGCRVAAGVPPGGKSVRPSRTLDIVQRRSILRARVRATVAQTFLSMRFTPLVRASSVPFLLSAFLISAFAVGVRRRNEPPQPYDSARQHQQHPAAPAVAGSSSPQTQTWPA
jgi:hypothetical protein